MYLRIVLSEQTPHGHLMLCFAHSWREPWKLVRDRKPQQNAVKCKTQRGRCFFARARCQRDV
eukprot:11258741-Prorocentrum_lima.AAC.1